MTTLLTKTNNTYLVSKNLSLIIDNVNSNSTTPHNQKTVSLPTSHIVAIDVSGSMFDTLTEIRKGLRNKLVSLIKDKDDISIIYFSGSSICGTLFEEVPINTLSDLTKINNLIEKFLVPQGFTSFYDPLLKIKELVKNIKSKRPDNVISCFFVSDGFSNSGKGKSDILDLCKELSPLISSSTICGYGNYNDSPFLQKMAEQLGGTYIDSEEFSDYTPIFEASLTKKLNSNKKIEVSLTNKPKHNLVLSVASNTNDITVYTVDTETNTVLVPDDTESIVYITDDHNISNEKDLISFTEDVSKRVNNLSSTDDVKLLQNVYAMINVLAQRMKSKDVYQLLSQLGDKQLISKYANAFGKQDRNEFVSLVLLKVRLEDSFYKEGFGNTVTNDNAYCVMNLIEDLGNDSDARLYPKNPNFKYNRISSQRKQVGSILTDDDKLKLQNLSEQLKNANDVDQIKQLNDQISVLTSSKIDLKFVAKDTELGYLLSSFTWNETRPNLSLMVRYEGTVELPKDNQYSIKEIPTFQYRNYTIIKDGIVNIEILPVSISQALFNKLQLNGLISVTDTWLSGKIFVINLRSIPVINRSMVTSVDAKDFFMKTWELTELQASQKVFGYHEKLNFPKQSVGFNEKYGEEASKWLSELGLTDFNGFSPKTIASVSGDSYQATELQIKIKSFSSLPSVNAVQKKLDSEKSLTPSESLLNRYMIEYEEFITSNIYTNSANKTHLLETWLKDKKKDATQKTKKLMTELSQIKFSILLSQTWFNEFDDIDNSILVLPTSMGDIEFTAVLKDTTIEI